MTQAAAAGARAILLRASERAAVPWRNGGGTTTIVATSGEPAGRDAGRDPDWRVSIATIAEAGDFSVFPGVDRVLMPLSPAGLTLDVGGRIRYLEKHEPISFRGEEAVAAIDVASAGDDLNLMTRRGECAGSLVTRRIEGAESFSAGVGDTVLVIVLEGDVSWAAGPLPNRDAVLLPSGAGTELIGHGTLAVVTVRSA